MSLALNAYLNFKDNARQAMEFYGTVFGGHLDVKTFKDLQASRTPEDDNLVMHSVLEGENGIVFMGADTPSDMEYKPGTNFNMSLSGDDDSILRGYFEKLSAGGMVTMPLQKALWGDTFGMCTDKFGVNWVVNISGTPTET